MEYKIIDVSTGIEPSEPLKFISEDSSKSNIDEIKQIISALDYFFDKNKDIIALSAPQIGVNKRIFGIRFNTGVKYFINPIITKKIGLVVSAESFINAPTKEYLVGRPSELTVVYYNSDFKYEDNKLLGDVARYFDQMCQILDGVLPGDLGLESDINTDGKLADLSADELDEAFKVWQQYIKIKLKALENEISTNKTMNSVYKQLKLSEGIINGRIKTFTDSNNNTPPLNRSQRRQLKKISKKGKNK